MSTVSTVSTVSTCIVSSPLLGWALTRIFALAGGSGRPQTGVEVVSSPVDHRSGEPVHRVVAAGGGVLGALQGVVPPA